ncbi:phospho-acceptor domain-containing protein [Mucilaginibacter gracilis]|uniref:histidine kinase n=1 Tax=Mucilaginibacter gracilis TaxID=423350 RepID=A0A495IX64_9SPHI|nr:HAMP domain-containing sensor histidine kinase [Mucilaginibacter gracilis]RKR81265.1 phospho-acceptor domain-containing protein [Mucilaginibacter gracilis]
MKRKLGIAFTLITLSLIGIIVFQGYWTVNAYHVNKRQFDADIDSAMLRAMDHCKKDYFDSIRVVITKKLSSPDYLIRIDTTKAPDPSNVYYDIRIAHQSQRSLMMVNDPFTIRKLNLDYYKRKINFTGKESIPALLAETSFYVPNLLYHITWAMQMADMDAVMKRLRPGGDLYKVAPDTAVLHKQQEELAKQNPNPFTKTIRDTVFQNKMKELFRLRNITPRRISDSSFTKTASLLLGEHMKFMEQKKAKQTQIEAEVLRKPSALTAPIAIAPRINFNQMFKEQRDKNMPPNYPKADSIKIYRYLKRELEKANIDAPFTLNISGKKNTAKTFNTWYSETTQFPYRYHGFDFLTPNILTIDTRYTKAFFKTPQYAVMRGMMLNLTLSILLILLTGLCFTYVVRTIVEQKKLAELKDDFINNMTHELKTPIATIAVAIEGLQNFNALNDPVKTQRYLQTSREQLERLNQLVTKVLNVAAFENRDIDLHIEPVNIDAMLEGIILSEQVKTTKQVNMGYVNQSGVQTLNADKLHLNSVVLNLVDNAIKYAGNSVDVAIMVYKQGDSIVFSVKDNGIGISAEHITHVFDKFYRVPTGNVHNVKGTGLGLSYVKYIVEAHGGNIKVKSNIGAGSEFIITLPVING